MDEALGTGGGGGALAGATLAQVVLHVRDLAVSRAFYEDVLGLARAEEDESSATYDTGPARLRLHAGGEEAELGAPDPSADLTFLVPELDAVRAGLAARGVSFPQETMRYVIGATTGFHDPDGHRISLYEPSEMALGWPSGGRVRALMEAGPAPGAADLGGSPLVYLFLFVPDAEEAMGFYHGVLGLPYLECRACRRGSTEHPRGVVKYDAGGLLLTTHLYEGPEAEAAGALSASRMKGLAPVFRVDDVDRVVDGLAARGVRTARWEAGGASFDDPFGRTFLLMEHSAAAAR